MTRLHHTQGKRDEIELLYFVVGQAESDATLTLTLTFHVP
jgi:hypothetical protein